MRVQVDRKRLFGLTIGLVVASLTTVSHPNAAAGSSSPRGAARAVRAAQELTGAAALAERRALLDQYCVTCHNTRLKTANLTLDTLDLAQIGEHAEVWEKVVQKVQTGAMPPPGRPRPDTAAAGSFVSWLANSLDAAAAAHPNPGAPGSHRLNRAEYTNVIHDLLALDIDSRTLLPADDAGFGFDNIADTLSVSPGLLERYIVAAQTVARLAVGDPTIRPVVDTYKQLELLRQEDRVSEELPFGTRGGVVAHHFFPVDGTYSIKVTLQRSMQNRVRGVNERNVLELYVDGALIKQFTIFCDPRRGVPGADATDICAVNVDNDFEVRLPFKAGTHIVGAAFQKHAPMHEGLEQDRVPVVSFAWAFGAQVETSVDAILIGGPYDVSGAGESESRRRIFVCHPTGASDEERCAKTILGAIARRAYRRPVTDADLRPLLKFYRAGRQELNFDSGIQFALEGILVSPHFLFRSERQTAGAVGAYRVADLELASRLSFFLWSSIPDDELIDLAVRGQLHTPAVLLQQVKRMLADPRSQALISNFGGQWLFLRNLPTVVTDPHEFPDFDDNLRDAFQRETELFFASQVRENRPIVEMLTADYTFANERLAQFYGIPNVYGNHFRRVALPDARRRGLLGQASILMATSYGNRTSPVLRGKWILENVLGSPPPPPPPNVPALVEEPGGALPKTMRERMSQHRANPVCAACHARIDPLGFALENFDALGQWRDAEGATPIDASGALPDGTRFNGAAELRAALLKHQQEFVTTVTTKLLTYAMGRGVEYYDMPAVRQILREGAPDNYPWTSLIVSIVKSAPFQMRRAEP
jgi:hypothetical protein